MKKSFVLMLCTCSVVYAESRVLPPVVDNSTYASGSRYKSTAAPSANAMYEVIGRLEQLQAEVQQLTGVVEEQAQTIADLKKRQSNIYSDLDQRIQEISGVDSNNIDQQAIGVTGQNQKLLETVLPATSDQHSNTKLNTAVDSQAINSSKTVESNSSIPAMKASMPSDIISQKGQKQRYQAAYETLRNGHNTRAIAEFKLLLTDFPKGEYADNAQYWLGEAYKVNQNISASRIAFTKVINVYSNSPKVPDALLKLGYIELEQNNKAKARDYLTQVTVNYPATTAAHLATKKLIQMGVMQH